MPAIIIIILFGILQGLTEFLPISSSGHLSIFQYFTQAINNDLSLNVAVHLGTFFTIIVYYHQDLYYIARGFFNKEKECVQMIMAIIVASIPTAAVGLFMKMNADWILTNPLVAAFCLIITGFLLLASGRVQTNHFNPSGGFGINLKKAFLIGLVQGFAVLPGISRSGSTIVTGLFLGMTPTNASRFSFLISLPAILGAVLLEFKDIDESVNVTNLTTGALISFVTGLVAISWMVRLTQRGQLDKFAYYVFSLALCFFALYSLGLGEGIL